MKEEILAGYPISAFLQAQEGRDWKPDTRRRYSKYLYELGEYLAGQGPPGKAALEQWQRQLEERLPALEERGLRLENRITIADF